jgi:AcrR family transcriptional regulator
VAVEQTGTGGRRAGTPPTARGRRTRAQLVAAAKAVFQELPFTTARIADITREAGVSTGTFYVYFDSKEQIFREVAAEVLTEMSSAPRRAGGNEERDPIRQIANSTRRYFRTCLDNAGIARSIEQLSLTDDEVRAERRGIVVDGVRRAERWIVDLQARGICDSAIDPWTTAMALHTMTVRVAYDHVMPTGGDDLEEIVEAVTHVWARTVGLERVSPERDRPSIPDQI